MKIHKFEVFPLSSFLTYPKGDMLYSFFIYWWIKLKKDISIIEHIVFSDFLPKGYFPKPALPVKFFTIDDDKIKELKSLKWIKDVENLNSVFEVSFKNENIEFFDVDLNIRNNLNRLTNTSFEEAGLHAKKEINFNYPVNIYIATDFNIKEIENFLNTIGLYGFGKNSGLKGQFQVKYISECNWEKKSHGISLSPLISENLIYYDVFTRFGKHFCSTVPFKKPVLMADTGSVVRFSDFIDGSLLKNGIKNESVIQARSIIYPFDLKD